MLPSYEVQNPQQFTRFLILIILFLFTVIGINLTDILFQKEKQPTVVEKYLLEKKEDLNYSVTKKASTESTSEEEIPAKEVSPVKSGQVASALEGIKLYLGFAVEPITTSRISEVEGQLGRKFDLLMGYIQWGNKDNSKLSDYYMNQYSASGKTPIISWEPWDPNQGVEQEAYKLTNISAGNFDSYIQEFALSMKKYGRPIFLRFAHEMNGNWYPWGGTVNSNSATDYKNAWRHTHTIFQQVGASNVNWIWSPDATSYPKFGGNAISDYYPGGDYVDWIGLDGYNWGPTKFGKSWESFESIFTDGYNRVLSYGKPIMVAEFSSTEVGGNKGQWIEETFLQAIPTRFPKIKAIVWFSINRETSWDFSSSQGALNSFRKIANSGIFVTSIKIAGSRILAP